MIFLAAAYTVILLVVFFLVFNMVRRQRSLEAELDMLEEAARRHETSNQ